MCHGISPFGSVFVPSGWSAVSTAEMCSTLDSWSVLCPFSSALSKLVVAAILPLSGSGWMWAMHVPGFVGAPILSNLCSWCNASSISFLANMV